MVDKSVLQQYMDLKSEIEEVRDKIVKLENRLQKITEEGKVKDAVKGGNGGIQTFHIEGFPDKECSRVKSLLYARKTTLSLLESDIEEQINRVEEFINSIKDSRMRRIINLRFVQGKSWREISKNIGQGYTEDAVKKEFYRFMEKK